MLCAAHKASAATEFISTIRATGGDYSMLSTWEAAVQSNLTASTTVVYSGTGAGGLPAGTVLELFRGGIYQNITASTTATTTTQILVNSFSGSYKVLQDGDEWRVASSTANMWTVSGTGAQLGDSPIAIAQIDGAWTSPDTTAVTIAGWTTSATNYIKIYTTTAARHSGVWDEGKYRLQVLNTHAVYVREEYVRVEGLQVLLTTTGTTSDLVGIIAMYSDGTYAQISHNIVKGNLSGTCSNDSGIVAGASYVKVFNNIVYDFLNGEDVVQGIRLWQSGTTVYTYNNTVVNCRIGYFAYSTYKVLKNNIAQNCNDGFNGTFGASSDYNISDIVGDQPASGSNDKTDTTVSFADEANDDFHISSSDTGAKDSGTNLSADANLPFTDDIDGQTRAGTWDIGADEAAEEIYRSVGPSKTTALAVGTSNALTISGSTATFASGLPDNVGVGDALQYDSDNNGAIDAICFIHARTSSTVYAVKKASGAIPTATVAADNDWSIFRAYTSLALAETGTENTGINATVLNFDTWTLGKDISSSTGSNEQWNIACYANGTTADTAAVTIDGWTTTADNYIKIYTPVASSEVGTSQRHNGKWDTGKYRLEISGAQALYVQEDYVRIDGLQVKLTLSSVSLKNTIWLNPGVSNVTDIRVSNCIIRGALSGTSDNSAGIITWYASGTSTNTVKIWNNIIYDFKNGGYGDLHGIRVRLANYYIYNNTIINCYNGIYIESGTSVAKNNISYGNSDNYNGTFTASTNNLSGPTQTDAPGTNPVNAAKVIFIDEANDDFHLAPNDYSAINAGTNLSADSYLAFSDDIDGETRPISTGWDIGADESYLTKFKFNNGTFKIKGKAIFR
ncbi:hypothetical protein L6249_02390 [Candidatus Parcubacteria bacterium]|nr:hypothetical protein [Candidatus Parcubacteria bacterium]